MAARKSRAEHAGSAPAFSGRVSTIADLAEARGKIAQLTAALEAEHKLAGELGVAKAKLEKEFAAHMRAAEARFAALQDDIGALTLSLSDVANELEALKADSVEEIKRLRRELTEASGDVAMHRLRDERAHAALASLALSLGDAHAELRERDDDDALAGGRREAHR